MLFALVVASLMINWTLISLTHLKFRKIMGQQGIVPGFKSFWFPYSNYLCLAFMAMIICVMWMIPGIRASVYRHPGVGGDHLRVLPDACGARPRPARRAIILRATKSPGIQ